MYHIAQLTDLHLFADRADDLKGVPTWETFADVLDRLEQDSRGFDLLVFTGDLAHDERLETYQLLRERIADRLPRCRMVPGNHDDRRWMRQVFPEITTPGNGPVTFAVDADGWRLIGLDSQIPGEVPGRIERDQLDWLAADLRQHPDRPTVLFLHHPPISVGSAWLDRIGLEEPQRLIEIVTAAEQVRVVCAGHVHHEFEGRIGGATVWTSPSTGLQFCPEGDESAYEHAPPGFRALTLNGDEFSSEVVRLSTVRFPPAE